MFITNNKKKSRYPRDCYNFFSNDSINGNNMRICVYIYVLTN